MERGQPSNSKGKGKDPMVEEDRTGGGDDNNINPTNIIDTSVPNLDLSLAHAPHERALPAAERLDTAADVMRRTRGTGAEGSSSGRRKMHKCKFCEKEFSTSQALGGHQNAHKPERVAAKFQESLGKMGAMGRDPMNVVSGRYQPYYFNPTRTLNIGGPPSSRLNLGPSGVPPTRQQPLFQSPHSTFLSLANRFPSPGQVPPPPVPRQGGNESGSSRGFSQMVRSWSEYLLKPRNPTSEAGSSNLPIERSTAGEGSSMNDGRRLMYYPGGIGFGPQSIIGNNPNANINQNLNLFGHNLNPNANPFGNVHPATGNVNPFNNVGANIGAAAPPPADDHHGDDEDENEGDDQEELDLTLKL